MMMKMILKRRRLTCLLWSIRQSKRKLLLKRHLCPKHKRCRKVTMESPFKFNNPNSRSLLSSSTNRVNPSISRSISKSTSQQITTNNKVTTIKKTRRRKIRRTRTRSDDMCLSFVLLINFKTFYHPSCLLAYVSSQHNHQTNIYQL